VNARPKLVLAILALTLLACSITAVPAAFADPKPTTLTLEATPAALVVGESATLAAHVGVPGATLTLSRRYAYEAGFTVLGTSVADDAGDAAWRDRPAANATYRVDYAGDATNAAASAEATAGVRPRVRLRVDFRKPLIEGRRMTFTIRVSPVHGGGAVILQRWTKADGWIELAALSLDGSSAVTHTWKAGKHGVLKVRAYMPADVDHLAGSSVRKKYEVLDPSNPYGVPYRFAHLILVDLSKYKLYYHEHGQVVRVFDCVLGRPGLPTPKGHYRIYAKDPNIGGPYGPRRMRYLGLYAIHGTNEPWLLNRYPRNFSHGCTRLSNAHILWLYSRVHVGTPVWNVP